MGAAPGTFVCGLILFTEAASLPALPERDDLHDGAERLELSAGLWVVVGAEEAFPRVVDDVIGLAGLVAAAGVGDGAAVG